MCAHWHPSKHLVLLIKCLLHSLGKLHALIVAPCVVVHHGAQQLHRELLVQVASLGILPRSNQSSQNIDSDQAHNKAARITGVACWASCGRQQGKEIHIEVLTGPLNKKAVQAYFCWHSTEQAMGCGLPTYMFSTICAMLLHQVCHRSLLGAPAAHGHSAKTDLLLQQATEAV